ncbi:MAG: ribulose-phosphate 3-epimerase [Pirellulaceae bacterium]|nr:ribulose-phosphate 3-epimerase [Pirellulaceae bacterium]
MIELMENELGSRSLRPLIQHSPAILPSLLQCDFGNLHAEIERLEAAGVTGFHLDVMDGNFVPNFTYGMPIVAAVRKLTKLPLDVHLMMSHPERYWQQFVDAGADCLTIHAEIQAEKPPLLEAIRRAGIAAGIAVNPGTALQELEDCLDQCDLLLAMSVQAGFGGQAFNPIALDKLRSVKTSHPGLLLEIDGGVNRQTIGSCVQAGAQLLVVGSAIFNQPDYRQAIDQLSDAMCG